MPLDFIPLLPDAAPSAWANRQTSPSATAASQDAGFVALLPGDAPGVVPGARPESPGAPAHERLPVVTLKRDGDRVTRIQVRCSCGEVVELDCVYS